MKKSILNDVITIDNEIQHGKPVLRGTRLPIAVIIGSLASGIGLWTRMKQKRSALSEKG